MRNKVEEIGLTGRALDQMPYLGVFSKGAEIRVACGRSSLMDMPTSEIGDDFWDSIDKLGNFCTAFDRQGNMLLNELDIPSFKKSVIFKKGSGGKEIIEIKDPEMSCNKCYRKIGIKKQYREIPLTRKAFEKMPYLDLIHIPTLVEKQHSIQAICGKTDIVNVPRLESLVTLLSTGDKYNCTMWPRKTIRYRSCLDTEFLKKSVQFRRGPNGKEVIDIKDPRMNCRDCSRYNEV